MSRYKILRTWALFLIAFGAITCVFAAFGVISWAISVEGFWETLGVIFFGAPIVILLALWPVALGQAMRAIADIGDAVTFDGATATAPARPY